MGDKLLEQLAAIAENFDGPTGPEIFITIHIGGERISGALISSRNFMQFMKDSPIDGQITKALVLNPNLSFGAAAKNPPEHLHLLIGHGVGHTESVVWRFRISAVDGFTLGKIPKGVK